MSGDDGVGDSIRFFTLFVYLLTDRLDLSTGIFLRGVWFFLSFFRDTHGSIDRTNVVCLALALALVFSISISAAAQLSAFQ